MGTTVSNLQILGVSLEDVRAALPYTLVGQWSERFVTACPDLSPRNMERQAAALSKELDCTLLLVSMFDGDALWLTPYQGGKKVTSHTARPDSCKEGNPKLFCSALGLPGELAPKLKRLFTDCSSQEEKLHILQALLGAPLFLRWDSENDPPGSPIQADTGPLERWLAEHPAPLKDKNQCKAEPVQEIPDRWIDSYYEGTDKFILRPAVRKSSKSGVWYTQERRGDILGYACTGGEWAYPLPDGTLELTPLSDPHIPPELQAALLPDQPPAPDISGCSYAALGQRLVTFRELLAKDSFGAYYPAQTVIVHDTVGILPCPLPLAVEEGPAAVDQQLLLPDGGFLVLFRGRYDHSCPPLTLQPPTLARFAPDGTLQWSVPQIEKICLLAEQRIYAFTCKNFRENCRFLSLDLDGRVTAQYSIPDASYTSRLRVVNGTPYIVEESRLSRFTPDLQPDGVVKIPAIDQIVPSSDGALLYCVSACNGIQVLDAATLSTLCKREQWGPRVPVVDGQNRLWVENNGYFECYTWELELVSRHQLKERVCRTYCSADGHACALTFQENKYIVRVYRFS